MRQKNRRSWFIHLYVYVGFFLAALTAGGCAHYPPNRYLKEASPEKGYRLKSSNQVDKSDKLLLFLAFSGGGTRAASLAYGVLEELGKTEVHLDGRNRSLLDEVDVISSVSECARHWHDRSWHSLEFHRRCVGESLSQSLRNCKFS